MRNGILCGVCFCAAMLALGRASTLQFPSATPDDSSEPAGPRSRVVLVERPSVVDKFTLNGPAVAKMWQDALLRLTDEPTAAAAWKKLGIKPDDVVGIKIAAHGNDLVTPPPCLVDAIARSLTAAGVPAGQIIVWDRDQHDLAPTLYGQRDVTRPYAVRSVVPETGFDPNVFYVNEITGKLIWGDLLFRGKSKEDLLKMAEAAGDPESAGGQKKSIAQQEIDDQTSNRSYFAKLLTQTCTKIVNVAVVIDDDSVGLGGCLASLALGSVDNSRRFLADGINGDPAIAEILDRDLFRKKVVLHVSEGLIAQYAGGPFCSPEFTHSPGALYVSADPVAIDALVLPRLEAWRLASQVVPIGALARHVQTCAQQGLGNADPKLIDLIKLP